MDNTPVPGCGGCATTGGRMSCEEHRHMVWVSGTAVWPADLRIANLERRVAELERLLAAKRQVS